MAAEQQETMLSFSSPELYGLEILGPYNTPTSDNAVFDFANHLASLGLETFSTPIEALNCSPSTLKNEDEGDFTWLPDLDQ